MAKWAAHDDCNAKFTDARITPHVVRRTWTGCKPGSASVYYIIEGGGHTWPGAIPVDGSATRPTRSRRAT